MWLEIFQTANSIAIKLLGLFIQYQLFLPLSSYELLFMLNHRQKVEVGKQGDQKICCLGSLFVKYREVNSKSIGSRLFRLI
jgi:hypothetical protein